MSALGNIAETATPEAAPPFAVATEVRSLVAVIDAMPDSTMGGRKGMKATFDPPIDSVRCSDHVTITVPVGAKQKVISRTVTVRGDKDKDSLKLVCSGS